MRYLFTLLLVFSIFASRAQLIKNEQKIGWKVSFDDLKLKSFPNKDNSLNCVVITNNDSITANVYNAKLEILYSFSAPNNKSIFKSYYGIGGFFRDSLITVVLKNNSNDSLQSIIYNIKNTQKTTYTTPFNKKNKIYACTINTGDNCYFISAGKKIPFLSVVSFENEGKTKETIFELNKDLGTNLTDNEMLAALLTNNGGFNRFANFAVVDKNLETNANSAVFKNKIYTKNDNLILSVDDNPDKTRIFTLNLINNSCNYQAVRYSNFKKSSISALYTQSNSIIVENTLYHLVATSDNLKITALNLNSRDTLIKYLVNKNDDINFKNTEIFKENTKTFDKDIKKIKTNQLLAKIANNNAVISGFKNKDGIHQITVGGYQLNPENSLMILPMAGGLIGAAIASGIAAASNNSWHKVTRFKSLFDPLTAQHIAGEITETGSDLIDDYTKGVEMPTQGSDTFYCDGNTYYTYYDNKLKSLIVLLLK